MGYIGCKESCDSDRMSKGLFTLMEAKPTLIKERVCKRVIGQDDAVSRTVDNLMLMAKTKVMREKGMSPFATPRQSSFCIIGPTASGKTHMVKVICDVLDMPLFSVDCTALTGTGWRGAA